MKGNTIFAALLVFWASSSPADGLPPGHPSLPKKNENGAVTTAPLPNSGVIENTFQSGGYSYIEVSHAGSSRWLAAPAMELAKGMRIRYSKGVPMADFYSRSLKRRFDRILFVGRVEVARP